MSRALMTRSPGGSVADVIARLRLETVLQKAALRTDALTDSELALIASLDDAAATRRLLPLPELLRAAHRVILSLFVSAESPALPMVYRDQALQHCSNFMRFFTDKLVRPRLNALLAYFIDPSHHLASLRNDVMSLCTVDDYARVDRHVRRLLVDEARRGGLPQVPDLQAVVSNVAVLLIDVAPFDAVFLTDLCLGDAMPPVRAELERRCFEDCRGLRTRTMFFNVPPPSESNDSDDVDAMVVDAHRTRVEGATRAQTQLPGAPTVAHDAVAEVAAIVAAPLDFNAKRPRDEAQPQNDRHVTARAAAIRKFIKDIGVAVPQPAAAAQCPPAPPERKRVGHGIRRLPVELQIQVLTFLPPRSLRAAQATCRRFAWAVNRNAYLQRSVLLSGALRRRFEWFLTEEWGERVAALAMPELPADVAERGPEAPATQP